ncbi:coproporphyrinogen-III oxidase family protein [Lentzea sp. NEAU-D7]|uniref:coproporphyrinogen-III oxidase family protein n=1 Tax=Lentzea sp. NEAU-D7 TaxID=2994667 RepID=UPI00224B32D0|nr:coproporphyrinogen-III oxidase family protein [Lentzea sp. NEAU-D7]MCX2951551.1 coproporphyrinogen-III oxidase family protein [Lentzea sp. NEAU-D7]
MSTESLPVPARAVDEPLLLYVNIPFCNSKCHFCDWVVDVPIADLRLTPVSSGRIDYLEALRTQIRTHAPALRAAGYRSEVMYWGGGTATVLTEREIEETYSCLAAEFDLSTVAEATIEGSPESVDLPKLKLLRDLGFDRVSLGVQSFDTNRLRRIGRAHSADQAVASVEAACAAGFENINIDLIVGFPDQTLAEVRDTVRRALELPVNHFSVYAYRATEGTVMRKQIQRAGIEIELEHQLKSYRLAADLLTEAGHPEYAVSYFGAPRCLADEAYYRLRMDWIGFGTGANSLINHRYLLNGRGRMRDFTSDPGAFEVNLPAAAESLTVQWLPRALSTAEGIDAVTFQRRTGVALRAACEEPELNAFLRQVKRFGDLVVDRDGIRIADADRSDVLSRTFAAMGWVS